MEAVHFANLANIGLAEGLRRLAVNKPGFIGPAAVAASAGVYITATAALAAIALVAEQGTARTTTESAAARR